MAVGPAAEDAAECCSSECLVPLYATDRVALLRPVLATLAYIARRLFSQTCSYRAMSSYSLADAIKPSRKSVPPSKAAKGRKGDIDLPDYIAPEPKTAAERREWDRMSSRMEGEEDTHLLS